MTPERKEEIRQNYPANSAAGELLAALEKAEHQIADIKTINASLVRTINAVEEERDDKARESDTFYEWWEKSRKDYDRAVNELAEAQQTIARQREALEEIAEYGGTDMIGATCATVAQKALGEGAKES